MNEFGDELGRHLSLKKVLKIVLLSPLKSVRLQMYLTMLQL